MNKFTNLEKPITHVEPMTATGASVVAAIGLSTAASIGGDYQLSSSSLDDGNYRKSFESPKNNSSLASLSVDSDSQQTMNIINFSRLYKIGQIPVFDFIIIYVLLYIINRVYFHWDCKIILVVTIPITIVFNLLTNERIRLTNSMMILLLLSTYVIFESCYRRKLINNYT